MKNRPFEVQQKQKGGTRGAGRGSEMKERGRGDERGGNFPYISR